MSTSGGYNTRNRVACYKCKQRHKPPVGVSCSRITASKGRTKAKAARTNVTNTEPVVAGTSSAGTSQQPQITQESETNAPQKKGQNKRKQPSTSEVMSKLTQFMDKFADIEKRLDLQEQQSRLSLLSQPSAHSSPKSSVKQRSHSAAHDSSVHLPSMDSLRQDSEVQARVDRRMRQYENLDREDSKGTLRKVKSGRYRLGDQAVKHHVNWPHEFCSVGENLKMPTYEDINIFQWVQGFSRCVLEEKDPNIRTFMLQYQSNLMQDALELSWPTAKRAHAAVLTEVERGQVTWKDQIGIDRIRQRFTQRVLKAEGPSAVEEQTRVCKRYNEDVCTQAKDHTDGKTLYKHSCYTCFKAVKRHYPHPEAKCNRAKRHNSQSVDKARV